MSVIITFNSEMKEKKKVNKKIINSYVIVKFVYFGDPYEGRIKTLMRELEINVQNISYFDVYSSFS